MSIVTISLSFQSHYRQSMVNKMTGQQPGILKRNRVKNLAALFIFKIHPQPKQRSTCQLNKGLPTTI